MDVFQGPLSLTDSGLRGDADVPRRVLDGWSLLYALLASCYGHLGHMAEGQKALAELFRINPDFSIERRRRVLPFKNPKDFERRVEGLRKAGLTE